MRRLFACLLAVMMLAACTGFAFATQYEETEDVSGEADDAGCGDGLSWFLDGDTLYIYGSGEMCDFEEGGAPWQGSRSSLKKVVFDDGITYVGANSFRDFDSLTQVQFGSQLMRIGQEAFSSCDGLTSVELPKTFKKFGEKSFYSCRNLTEIHCAGSFPRFDENCLWDTWCKIYFPAEAPWSVILIEQLENAFHGRIEFLASDGTDPYTPTEATEPETTEAPTTQPETVPETTAAPIVTEPETTAPAAPETTQAPQTEYTHAPEAETILFGTAEQTTAPEKTPAPRHTGGIGLAIVVMMLSLIAAAVLVFRITERRR